MTRDGRHTLHIGWCPLLATGPGPGVGVIPIIITFSQFPHSLGCNCPDVSSPAFASSQATYANQTRAQMSRLGMRGESWEMFQTHGCDVWWGTTRLPSPSALAVKCAPIQILTPRAAPSCLLKHSYNWSSQLSWFLFTESWGLMSVRFDPDLSIFPPDNHPSPLLLYCYRGSSSWQKTVSGRSKCFRKTNEANVNFLPVEFRSNNVFRFTRRKKETVKTVIIPKIWELRFSWMRSRFELFLLSSQIASTSISLVSNYEFQILVNIDHRTDQGLSLGPFWCVSWLLR